MIARGRHRWRLWSQASRLLPMAVSGCEVKRHFAQVAFGLAATRDRLGLTDLTASSLAVLFNHFCTIQPMPLSGLTTSGLRW